MREFYKMNRDVVAPIPLQVMEKEEEETGFSIWCSSKKFDDLMSCITEKFGFGKKETEAENTENDEDHYMRIERPYAFRLNCVLIGESGVGKSSIAKRFSGGSFSNSETCTIGIEFHTKAVGLKGGRVKLNIWDTSGHESFESLTRSYYRSAILVMLVFDLTNRKTFSNLDKWIERARKLAPDNVRLVLVGNKSDNAMARAVTSKEALDFAQKNKISYLETSAKTGRGVKNAFHLGCRSVWSGISDKSINPNSSPGVKELL